MSEKKPPMSDEKLYYKFWPENIPKTIEIPNISVDINLRNAALNYPDAIATTYFGNQLTYKKLDEIVDRIATYLANDLGIKKNETVALHFSNVPPCIACYYAVLRIGARVTLLSPLFQALEIKHQLNDSETKLFIVWEGFNQIVDPVIPETCVEKVIYSSLGPWFTPDPTVPGDPISTDGKTIFLEDMIPKTEPNPPKVEIDPENDIACLQYTGGTTGMPKGAMLTHKNLVANLEQGIVWFPEAQMGEEVMLTALPLYHIYAQQLCMNLAIRFAANQILVANPRDAEELLNEISRHKVTLFPGVAAIYNNLNNFERVQDYDLTSLKYCLSGAGPLPKEIQDKFEELTGAKLREGFGLTEGGPVTHSNPLDGRFKNGTVGFPFPNTEMKIVDIETGTKILPINEVGELCVKGPQIMKGYYKKDEVNKMTIRDGWLYTGDGALMDEEGYTKIMTRLKNLIKYKGHSVYPDEVEAFLLEHEAIFECGVIGIPDPKTGGENIKAFIALQPEFVGKITESEIIEWAKLQMAPYKYPREIEFLDELPKTNVGKILHRKLRDRDFD
ncbi:MAG: long-chain-fatty-acid--CoA ligase [Promethearchaeota archaeon]